MPPKCKFTRDEIITAALEITRSDGIDAVTARRVGTQLSSSSKVIFSLFKNMDELQNEVVNASNAVYQEFIRNEMESGKYPPYKASGMAYIRFAKEERELFKLLFMRDRSHEAEQKDSDETQQLIELIEKSTGLSEQSARMLHLEMWIYVHGIASMLVTDYLTWDWEFISNLLTDGYEGIRVRWFSKEAE